MGEPADTNAAIWKSAEGIDVYWKQMENAIFGGRGPAA